MTSHLFNLDGARRITTMGASWFVSYKYYELIDENHNNWAQVKKLLGNRMHAYDESEDYHEYWLNEVLKMSDGKLNRNKLGLTADEIKRMAREILSVMKSESL